MLGGFAGGGGGGGSGGFGEMGLEGHFRAIPAVTRSLGVAIFAVTVLSTWQLTNPAYLAMSWPLVLRRLHLWRPFTDYFYMGSFSFSWIFQMYFLVSYSSRLESHPAFAARNVAQGAYLFFLAAQMLALHLVSVLFYFPTGRPFMGGSLMFAIIYYWSKKEPEALASLWGFAMKGWQLPYALIVLDILMGGSPWQDVMGMITGHLYFYLRDDLPQQRGGPTSLSAFFARPPPVFDAVAKTLQFEPAPAGSPGAAGGRAGAGAGAGSGAGAGAAGGAFASAFFGSGRNTAQSN